VRPPFVPPLRNHKQDATPGAALNTTVPRLSVIPMTPTQAGEARKKPKAQVRSAPRPNAVDQYEVLMRSAIKALIHPSEDIPEFDPEDEVRVRLQLYNALAKPPIDPYIQRILDQAQLSAGWVRNHLLALGTWSPQVREAVRDGLPLRDGAVVARIRRAVLRKEEASKQTKSSFSHTQGKNPPSPSELIETYERRALEPFYNAKGMPPLERTGEAQVSAGIRLLVDTILAELTRDSVHRSGRWWIPATSPKVVPDRSRLTQLLLYAPLLPDEVRREVLPRPVAVGIIGTYLPDGRSGFLIDPMAGSGTVIQAALDLGHRAWGGDLTPVEPYVDRYDATLSLKQQSTREALADLLVVHPPTYATWKEQMGESATAKTYLAFVQQVLDEQGVLVAPAGHVILIVQGLEESQADGRGAFMVSPPASHPQVVGWHVAVARDASQVWQILAFSTSVTPTDLQ
jgi:hypothetical protein